jgi:hypothetical protein
LICNAYKYFIICLNTRTACNILETVVLEGYTLLKKVLRLNEGGSIGIGIPQKLARELDLKDTDYVSIVKNGN